MFRAAARMSSPFGICPASITLGFPTSFNFLIRNTICPFKRSSDAGKTFEKTINLSNNDGD